jgi:hypothetical protein
MQTNWSFFPAFGTQASLVSYCRVNSAYFVSGIDLVVIRLIFPFGQRPLNFIAEFPTVSWQLCNFMGIAQGSLKYLMVKFSAKKFVLATFLQILIDKAKVNRFENFHKRPCVEFAMPDADGRQSVNIENNILAVLLVI